MHTGNSAGLLPSLHLGVSPKRSPRKDSFLDADLAEIHDRPDVVKAARDGDIGTLQSLWKAKEILPNQFYKAGPNKWTLLHLAADKGHQEIVKWLLGKKHVSPDVRDSLLWTPLHCAAVNGCYEVVQLLVKAGCNTNARNSERTTALHYLVRRDMDEKLQKTLEMLLKHGALIDPKNIFDETPLHSAVTRGKKATLEWLLAHDANANAVNKFGETPLMKAVAMRNDQMVQILLERGADPTFRAPESPIGDPIAVALSAGLLIMVAFLEDYSDRWLKRHPRESPEDRKWAALSTAERLKASPHVHKSLAKNAAAIKELVPILEKPPVTAWEGWSLEYNVPKVLGNSAELVPPTRYASQLSMKDPLNFLGALIIGKADPEPLVLTVTRQDPYEGEVDALLWTVRGTQTLTVPFDLLRTNDDKEALKNLLKYFREFYAQKYSHLQERVQVALDLAPQTDEFRSALLALEREDPQEPRTIAVGVLYVKAGQETEEEQLHNSMESTSADFQDFLQILGRKVTLQKHTGYKADLDVTERGLTGTHSIYHSADTGGGLVEIMYHVTPMLPSLLDEEGQQMVRKRFIGNDLTAIVFLEPGATFKAPIRSQMLHVYVIITPIDVAGIKHYQVAVLRKEEVSLYDPPVAAPNLFSREALQSFLLAKLVRGHYAALGSPKLTKLLVLAPKIASMSKLIRQFAPEGKDVAKHFAA